ncbi:hypothetical protein AAFF_G00174190 [Aldrovandia affinis]|uniref:Uncharacterized protein n=1 Tax=Aldrovandia affinis TaxID=143900 RepID=A0AAD7SZ82_9TELE|nr:hypothetical protein AAFF_G00174190 [Aldrovandia affinis]
MFEFRCSVPLAGKTQDVFMLIRNKPVETCNIEVFIRIPHHRKMPAGVSWPRYLRMFGASILAMFAGAEVVHRYYMPDLTIPDVPPKPGELRTELLGLKERESASQQNHQNLN